MAQKETTQRLDLDALMVETPHIVLGDGRELALREITTAEMLGPILAQVSAVGELPNHAIPGGIVDIVAGCAPDPDAARAFMRAVPLASLFDLLQWLQEGTDPVFRLPLEAPIATVTFDGRERRIWPLTTGAYLDALTADQAETDDAKLSASITALASSIEDTTADELMAMPHHKRRRLEEFIREAIEGEMARLNAKLAAPVKNARRAKRR